jgi:hypothetical protein
MFPDLRRPAVVKKLVIPQMSKLDRSSWQWRRKMEGLAERINRFLEAQPDTRVDA